MFDFSMEELHQKISKFISSRLDDKSLVADFTQETLLKLITYQSQKRVLSAEAFGIQIAKNLLTDHFRKNRKEMQVLKVEEDYNELVDEMLQCQSRYIDALDQESRELITKVDLNKISQKEIAGNLGVPYPSLRSKVQRARRKIKDQFETECILEYDKTGQVISCKKRSG